MEDRNLDLEYRVACWEVGIILAATFAIGWIIGMGLAL